jgi:predicted PurR-regulated permease PerM
LISLGFLLLVVTLVPAINQLKSLLTDLERTSSEFRALTAKLKEIGEKVETEADKVGTILDSSKRTAEVVSETLSMLNTTVFKKAAGILALIPAIKFGWNLVKKHKGGK